MNNESSPAETDHIWYYFNLDRVECLCGCVKLLWLGVKNTKISGRLEIKRYKGTLLHVISLFPLI